MGAAVGVRAHYSPDQKTGQAPQGPRACGLLGARSAGTRPAPELARNSPHSHYTVVSREGWLASERICVEYFLELCGVMWSFHVRFMKLLHLGLLSRSNFPI